MLKGDPHDDASYTQLEQQVDFLGQSRSSHIKQVCSVIRVSADQGSTSRMLQTLSRFLSNLPNLSDFWLLFQTAADALSEHEGPVKVHPVSAKDMQAFHDALACHSQLKRLSIISEGLFDQPCILVRLPTATSLFQSLPALETLSLRACIPVSDPEDFRDLSDLQSLSRLKIHNAGILRFAHGPLSDSWHFSVQPRLPPKLTHLALVLIDTSIKDLLKLLSTAADGLTCLSLMGIFLTDGVASPSAFNRRGELIDSDLLKSLSPPKLSALCFGRVTCLAGASAPAKAATWLLRYLLNADASTMTDLCLQKSDDFLSQDVIDLLQSPDRPRSLQCMLWWSQDDLDAIYQAGDEGNIQVPAAAAQSAQDDAGQADRNAAATPVEGQAAEGRANTLESLPLTTDDEAVRRACEECGVKWLRSLTPLLLDSLVHE